MKLFKKTLSKKSLAGPGYVILNVLRAMNIVAMVAVIGASILMLIKTTINSNFFFFGAFTHVVVASVAGFLIITELGFFSSYINKKWSHFGADSGFVPLGITMAIIGFFALACLNQDAYSMGSVGAPIWRFILAAGIVSIVVGSINVTASFIFCNNASGVNARSVRALGAVAEHQRSFKLNRTRSSNSILPTHKRQAHSRSTSSRSSGSLDKSKTRFPIISSPKPLASTIVNPSPGVGVAVPTPAYAPNLARHPALFPDQI